MKHKILIVPDKRKNATDAHLRCRIRWNGNIYAMLVGYKVIVAKWSYDSQRCKAIQHTMVILHPLSIML